MDPDAAAVTFSEDGASPERVGVVDVAAAVLVLVFVEVAALVLVAVASLFGSCRAKTGLSCKLSS
jgi:hypothetical protein